MKIKINSSDDSFLNRQLLLSDMMIRIRFVFKYGDKYYPQVFWWKGFYDADKNDLFQRSTLIFIDFLNAVKV